MKKQLKLFIYYEKDKFEISIVAKEILKTNKTIKLTISKRSLFWSENVVTFSFNKNEFTQTPYLNVSIALNYLFQLGRNIQKKFKKQIMNI